MSSDDDSTAAAGGSGRAGGRSAGRPRGLPSRPARWALLGVIVAVAVAAIVLLVLRTPDADESAVRLPDARTAWSEIAAVVPLDPQRFENECFDQPVDIAPYRVAIRRPAEACGVLGQCRQGGSSGLVAGERNYERQHLAGVVRGPLTGGQIDLGDIPQTGRGTLYRRI